MDKRAKATAERPVAIMDVFRWIGRVAAANSIQRKPLTV
jgi:hypothetical protein